jgi:hypothetical protein
MSRHCEEPERSRSGRAAPWCLWLLGLLTAFRPALRSGFSLLQIGPGDPKLIEYMLEHSWRFLLQRPLHDSFWNAPFFYPVEGVVAYTDPLLGAVAPYASFRLLGLAPGPAFQLWMLACLSLAFLAVYLLLTRVLGFGRWPSAVGAFLSGFGIARVATLNNPQLGTLFWGLFALVTLALALEAADASGPSRAPRWIAATAALLVLQVWSAFYPAFFFALLFAIAGAISLLLPTCRRRLFALVRRHPVACVASAAAAGLALLPLAFAHLDALGQVGWRPWDAVESRLPPPQSWIFPGYQNWVYTKLGLSQRFEFLGSGAQFSNGLGFVTALVSAWGLWLERRRPVVQLTLLTAAVTILLVTAWPGVGSLWTVVWNTVPGARAIRYPARIGMLLAIAGSIGLASALDRSRGRVPRAALFAVALCCLLEQQQFLRGYDDQAYGAAVRRIADRVDPGCEAFYLWHRGPAGRTSEGLERDRYTQLAAMWVGLDAGVPTINGFAGNTPSGWELENARHRDRDPPAVDRAVAAWSSSHGLRGRICTIEVAREQMPWYRE